MGVTAERRLAGSHHSLIAASACRVPQRVQGVSLPPRISTSPASSICCLLGGFCFNDRVQGGSYEIVVRADDPKKQSEEDDDWGNNKASCMPSFQHRRFRLLGQRRRSGWGNPDLGTAAP